MRKETESENGNNDRPCFVQCVSLHASQSCHQGVEQGRISWAKVCAFDEWMTQDTTDWRRARILVKTGRTVHSVCRELIVGLLLGVAKMGVTVPVWKIWSQQWTFAGLCKMWQKKTWFFIFLFLNLTTLGIVHDWGMQKVSVASLWRSGTAGRSFQTFDEQFVAVDDVRPTVSAGRTVF